MLGKELRRLRTERGLPMLRLSRLSGVSRPHLYAIESGQNERPYTDTLNKLARGLSSWRSGEPDESEAASIFRELQEAAGYPVDQLAISGDVAASPIPQPLAGPMLGILDGWPRWGETDRQIVVKLLSMASKVGEAGSDSLEHSESLDEMEQNQTDSSENKQQKLLALYLDKPLWPLAAAAFARSPERALATV